MNNGQNRLTSNRRLSLRSLLTSFSEDEDQLPSPSEIRSETCSDGDETTQCRLARSAGFRLFPGTV
jgi:hypothetical protein